MTTIQEATLNAKESMLSMYDRYLKLLSLGNVSVASRLLESLKALHIYFMVIDYYLNSDSTRIEITENDILDLLEVVKKELLLENLNNI